MKKLLLTLLLLLTFFVHAENLCHVNSVIKEQSKLNDFGVPLWEVEIKEKISKFNCKRNDILHLNVWVARDDKGEFPELTNSSESAIYGIAAEICNFNKTIIADTYGYKYNLVCVIK